MVRKYGAGSVSLSQERAGERTAMRTFVCSFKTKRHIDGSVLVFESAKKEKTPGRSLGFFFGEKKLNKPMTPSGITF
jgi:hypothetical protein